MRGESGARVQATAHSSNAFRVLPAGGDGGVDIRPSLRPSVRPSRPSVRHATSDMPTAMRMLNCGGIGAQRTL